VLENRADSQHRATVRNIVKRFIVRRLLNCSTNKLPSISDLAELVIC